MVETCMLRNVFPGFSGPSPLHLINYLNLHLHLLCMA